MCVAVEKGEEARMWRCRCRTVCEQALILAARSTEGSRAHRGEAISGGGGAYLQVQPIEKPKIISEPRKSNIEIYQGGAFRYSKQIN